MKKVKGFQEDLNRLPSYFALPLLEIKNLKFNNFITAWI